MQRRVFLIGGAIGAAALLLGASGSVAAGLKLPALDACGLGKPQIRPSQIMVACGDGNFFITRMQWSGWTQMSAAARGVGHQNDCKPYCAAGHFHIYAVAVRLSRPEVCRGRVREFTRLSVRFVGPKPSNAFRREQFDAGRSCP